MSPSAVASANGSPTAPSSSHGAPPPDSHGHRGSHSASKQTRSRTTIPTQSGKWILGKTIGAGSMGKVKLARKEDGSEQVCVTSLFLLFILAMLLAPLSSCLNHPLHDILTPFHPKVGWQPQCANEAYLSA